jgi:hypothetical protein
VISLKVYRHSIPTIGVIMKLFASLLVLLFAMSAFASSETRTFFYDGSISATQLNLNAEQTHTEYRYEQRQTICHRTETVYRTICTNGPQGRICRTVPQRRTVSYPCIRTVQIPYEVKDYDVVANVNLSVVAPANAQARETLKVTLNGDRLSLSASGSKKYLIVLKNQKFNTRVSGSVKFVDATYNVELVESAPVLNALSLNNMSVKNSVLNYTVGELAAPHYIGHKLRVEKAPILGSDTVLFNSDLRSDEINLKAQGRTTLASVDLDRLGVEFSSGRHTITSTIFFKYADQLLNASQFDKTEASKTLVFKTR